MTVADDDADWKEGPIPVYVVRLVPISTRQMLIRLLDGEGTSVAKAVMSPSMLVYLSDGLERLWQMAQFFMLMLFYPISDCTAI